MNKYFAKNLKYLRENKKLSKSILASKLNVSQSTISRWENNEMGITIDNAYDIASFFGISIAELTGKDLQNNELKDEINIKQILIKKGLMNEKDDISEEDAEKLIKFAIANKDYLIKK